MRSDRRKKGAAIRGRPPLEEVLLRVDEEVKLLHDHLGGLPRAVEADQILRATLPQSFSRRSIRVTCARCKPQIEAIRIRWPKSWRVRSAAR